MVDNILFMWVSLQINTTNFVPSCTKSKTRVDIFDSDNLGYNVYEVSHHKDSKESSTNKNNIKVNPTKLPPSS